MEALLTSIGSLHCEDDKGFFQSSSRIDRGLDCAPGETQVQAL
jgi:hypothetical protein